MPETNRQLLDRRIGAAWRQAAALPLWSDPVEPSDLRGGLSNVNFVVEDAGRKYVVRIGGDNEPHGVVRKNELAASRAAAAAGVAPRVIHAEPGVLVIDFIEGHTFAPEDVQKSQEPRPYRGSDPAHAQGNSKVPSRPRRALLGIPCRARLCPLAIGGIERRTAADPKARRAIGGPGAGSRADRPVFGHNDLLAANIIDDGKRLWLVDWEYAGFNSPLFDLGGLASNSEMPGDAARGSAARLISAVRSPTSCAIVRCDDGCLAAPRNDVEHGFGDPFADRF